MEGSGSYKIRDQQKSTNFKYIRNKIAESSEKGVEVNIKLLFHIYTLYN